MLALGLLCMVQLVQYLMLRQQYDEDVIRIAKYEELIDSVSRKGQVAGVYTDVRSELEALGGVLSTGRSVSYVFGYLEERLNEASYIERLLYDLGQAQALVYVVADGQQSFAGTGEQTLVDPRASVNILSKEQMSGGSAMARYELRVGLK